MGVFSMFNNGRKTIGVFISELHADFQSVLAEGITEGAKEKNYNVMYFTNFGGYGNILYDTGEILIADIPYYSDLDGIILASDTFELDGLESKIRNNIKMNSDCPVVSVRRKIDEYHNVLINDYTIIEDLIKHFVEEKGLTRVNFLAGPKGYPDSDKRLQSYKNILKKNNIPIEEERIFHGDFWKEKAYEAVDYWMESDLERPQAIICANDYMAIATCNALKAKGISVPRDIAVSGCDDVDDASINSPTITTARMPIKDMGIQAVNKIHNRLNGVEEEKDIYLKTTPIYRESCGCRKIYENSDEIAEGRRNYLLKENALIREIGRNTYMSVDLTGQTTLDSVVEKLFYLVYENIGFNRFCLCLKKNWNEYKRKPIVSREHMGDEMEMVMGQNGKKGFTKVKFNRRELIPRELVDDEPMILFFTIIHHRGDCFGYAAIGFEENTTYMTSYQAWINNISNALENARLHGEMNRLLLRLEDMSVRDELTGLFNRRAIETLGNQYLQQATDNNVKVMVLSADMDKMKEINDNHGHAKGDVALRTLADALLHASDDDEICIRMGGDEFAVIGLDYDEDKAKRYIKRFLDQLEKFNKDKGYDFEIHVSYGYTLVYPDINTILEDCLAISDAKMYKKKQEKKDSSK